MSLSTFNVALFHSTFYSQEEFDRVFGDLYRENASPVVVTLVDSTKSLYEIDYLPHSGTVNLRNTSNQMYVSFKYGGKMTITDVLVFLGFNTFDVGLQAMSDIHDTIIERHFDIETVLLTPIRALPRCRLIVVGSLDNESESIEHCEDA